MSLELIFWLLFMYFIFWVLIEMYVIFLEPRYMEKVTKIYWRAVFIGGAVLLFVIMIYVAVNL